MTPFREAIVLPLIFLSVVALGGARIGSPVPMRPPSPFMLVLALLLVRLLIQSGALAPVRLMSSARTAVANLNGAVVLFTLWIASAQTLATLTPDAGLPRVVFSVYFFLLLLNTAAASPDRVRLFRSLAVTFGAAFLLKFVVLNELSRPGAGWLKGVLQATLQGVTLGTLLQEVAHPATSYLALAASGLFLAGVVLLPSRDQPVWKADAVLYGTQGEGDAPRLREARRHRTPLEP